MINFELLCGDDYFVFMEIQHQIQKKTLVITPMGNRIDVISSAAFKDQVMELIKTNKSHQIVIDLHHIEFIDSAGLVCLLSLWKHMNKTNSSIKFAALTPTVTQIVELVLLNNVFDISETIEDAIK